MGVFSILELEYLGDQRLGPLATVGPDGAPHVVPVSFTYNGETDSIDIGGHAWPTRRSGGTSSVAHGSRSSSTTCCRPGGRAWWRSAARPPDWGTVVLRSALGSPTI